MLTSDDVSFAAGITDGVNSATYPHIRKGSMRYTAARADAGADPALVITFMPQIAGLAPMNDAEAQCDGAMPMFSK